MSQKKKYAAIGNWGVRPIPEGFGVTLCEYDMEEGSFTPLKQVLPDIHAGVSIWDPTRQILYCTDEADNLPEAGGNGGGGRVFALKFDREKETLKELNHQPTFEGKPSYVCLDDSGKYLIVSNHGGGTPVSKVQKWEDGEYHIQLIESDAVTVLYSLNSDGSIGKAKDIYFHDMTKGDPHLHSVTRTPDGKFFFVCDKGTAVVHTFAIENGKLSLRHTFNVAAKSAPRYSVCHPTLPIVYWNYEERTEICAGEYDETGKIIATTSYDLLAGEQVPDKKRQSSDLKMHPNQKVLYNLLRGVNLITVFSILGDGSLKKVQTVMFEATDFCGGGARWCTISPDQRYLHVAVTDDGTVHRFALDPAGLIIGEEETFCNGRPANIVFLQEEE